MNTPEYKLLAGRPQPEHGMQAANLPLIAEDEASPEVAKLYAHFRSRFGRSHVPGILQCFATHPPLLEHMMALSESLLFSDGALNRRQKEMIATFISSDNRCAYCADSHGFFLRVHHGSQELLDALLTCNLDTDALTTAERALLEFAAQVNRAVENVGPQTMQSLREHGWTNLQLAETIHLTSLFATFNRVVTAFGLPSQGLLADANLLGESRDLATESEP